MGQVRSESLTKEEFASLLKERIRQRMENERRDEEEKERRWLVHLSLSFSDISNDKQYLRRVYATLREALEWGKNVNRNRTITLTSKD